MVLFVSDILYWFKEMNFMSKMIVLTDYVISRRTVAILPIRMNGELYSKVAEEDCEFIVMKKPLVIMEDSCSYYGSSLDGRTKGSKAVTGYKYKAPIVIEQANELYFFPTTSPINPHCTWISYSHIARKESAGNSTTKVIFTNNKYLILTISIGSFVTQYTRTSELNTILTRRINENEQQNNFVSNQFILQNDPRRRVVPLTEIIVNGDQVDSFEEV